MLVRVQCEDKEGVLGPRLSKDLMKVAGKALKTNITTLGPLILPFSEKLLFALNMLLRQV